MDNDDKALASDQPVVEAGQAEAPDNGQEPVDGAEDAHAVDEQAEQPAAEAETPEPAELPLEALPESEAAQPAVDADPDAEPEPEAAPDAPASEYEEDAQMPEEVADLYGDQEARTDVDVEDMALSAEDDIVEVEEPFAEAEELTPAAEEDDMAEVEEPFAEAEELTSAAEAADAGDLAPAAEEDVSELEEPFAEAEELAPAAEEDDMAEVEGPFAEAEELAPAAEATEAEELAPAAEEDISEVEEPSAEADPVDADKAMFLAALSGESDADDDFMFEPPKRGQIIDGTVTEMSDSEILVDVGAKSYGVIAGRELESLEPEVIEALSVGDDIRVHVLNPEDREGHVVLSLRRALEEEDWQVAEEHLESRQSRESKVSAFNKGGLIVPFGRIRGFVPASQVSMRSRNRSSGDSPEERWGGLVGEPIVVKVIEVDRGRNRLILSERAAERELREKRRSLLIEELSVHQRRTGRVVRLTDFGAFVDLGGADGLVHLSELSWKHVNHPREVVNVGDEIEVEVISLDPERQRIGLSLKNCLADPWTTIDQDYSIGQLVQGKVTKLTKFGAFASLVERPAIEGLIHISELANHRVKHPREVLEEGDVVTLRIIRIEPDRRRLGLSLKQVDSEQYMYDDWDDLVNPGNS